MRGLFNLYVEGSVMWMTLITLALVGVLIAMWKAPKWVLELGLIGLATGMLGWLLGMCQACVAIIEAGDISVGVICGGMKVALIAPIYGVIVYLISVLISFVQSPRK